MKSLPSKSVILGLAAVLGLSVAPISFAQDSAPEAPVTVDEQTEASQAVDPYESYEQIKALGVVDPAVIPEPVEVEIGPEPEVVTLNKPAPADTMPDSDREVMVDIIETMENETRDSSEADTEIQGLSIVTLEAGDVEAPEALLKDKADIEKGLNAEAVVALPSLDEAANVTDAPRLARADILPFFLSAEEYLSARGGGKAAQTSLIYEVTTQPLNADAETEIEAPKPEILQLIIGPDYVAQQSDQPGSEFRIYDFKYNRLLRVLPPAKEGESANLINVSLYALAHRNTRTVASMTDQGKRGEVELGPVKLDAFWMESAMSWAMNDRLADMQTSRSDGGVEITYKDQPAFAVTFDAAAYPAPAQSDALLVFAHHNWPVHPSALREFFAAPAPVNLMTIISKTPSAPLGAKQIWQLKDRNDGRGAFPIPKDVVNKAVRAGADDPIAFVIDAAARGTALDGRPTQDTIQSAFTQALEDGDLVTAWLSAQRYISLFGPCDSSDKNLICAGLNDIEADENLAEPLTVLIKAFEDAQTSATRARALTALRPFASDPDAAAIILRVMGITRAKLGAATARATGLEKLDAETLMKASLARDPYDPQTYLGLAQYKASRGEFEAAWDIYDALRASINTRSETRFGVDKVEAALLKRAPGYFELPVMVTANTE